jgi:hypothetical protein
MPRFVILTHDHPKLHWDFMLEQEGALRTWRLAQEPDSSDSIEAEQLADHRIAYLDYEGPVSGGRGEVRCWDRGHFEVIEWTTSRLVTRLSGTRLKGIASLDRVDAGSAWSFRHGSTTAEQC